MELSLHSYMVLMYDCVHASEKFRAFKNTLLG